MNKNTKEQTQHTEFHEENDKQEQKQEEAHTEYHQEEDKQVANEKKKEEEKKNSPEQKEKEKQEEKAKEEKTKAETKAVAANKIDGYLHPELYTIYTEGRLSDLIRTGKFVPDPNGEISVYRVSRQQLLHSKVTQQRLYLHLFLV